MIVAGFGFRVSATVQSLSDSYTRAGAAEFAATLSEKVPGVFEAFAEREGLTILKVAAESAEAQITITQSDASQFARGIGSVAEAAALAAAGPGARLLGPRVISEDGCATCALAEGAA